MTKEIGLQLFTPETLSTLTLNVGNSYSADFVINDGLRPEMLEFECLNDIQIAINGTAYGVPKKYHKFGISKNMTTITFSSSALDSTVFIATRK